nr:MAG TPA: hypothetical protein [Caudoviricetes sp.]
MLFFFNYKGTHDFSPLFFGSPPYSSYRHISIYKPYSL